jgi:hypothetical protein
MIEMIDSRIRRNIAFFCIPLAYLLIIISSVEPANAMGYVTDHLVSEWNWTQDSGNTIVDPVSGNNGANYGSVLYTLPDGTLARRFNGNGVYIDFGTSASLDTNGGDFTIDTLLENYPSAIRAGAYIKMVTIFTCRFAGLVQLHQSVVMRFSPARGTTSRQRGGTTWPSYTLMVKHKGFRFKILSPP